ncbi:MAG: hypothetical protein ACUVUC_02965 [Thermoguttaceae bacterium]
MGGLVRIQAALGASGSSWATWGDLLMGGTGAESWYSVRSIRQQSTAIENLSRTITWNDQGQELLSGTDARSASATGSADSFCDSEWEDPWWLGSETWASGGTYQNGTYDDYNYQYQWTKTWQGQGEPQVNSSATNHVTGTENGSSSGWRTHTVGEGSGSGSGSGSGTGGGTSSGTSSRVSSSDSYDETVTYRGFYDGAYYALDY